MGSATFTLSRCLLQHSFVLTKCISGIDPTGEASMAKNGGSFSSDDVPAPVATMRERASATWCLAPVL